MIYYDKCFLAAGRSGHRLLLGEQFAVKKFENWNFSKFRTDHKPGPIHSTGWLDQFLPSKFAAVFSIRLSTAIKQTARCASKRHISKRAKRRKTPQIPLVISIGGSNTHNIEINEINDVCFPEREKTFGYLLFSLVVLMCVLSDVLSLDMLLMCSTGPE